MTEANLTLLHGDTYMERYTILREGAAADLTGCTIKLMVKPDPMTPDVSATLTLTAGSGLTVVDALAGIVDVEISAAQSASLSSAKTYVWDLQIVEPSGRVFTAAGGTLMLTHDVVLATS